MRTELPPVRHEDVPDVTPSWRLPSRPCSADESVASRAVADPVCSFLPWALVPSEAFTIPSLRSTGKSISTGIRIPAREQHRGAALERATGW
jgi:hypothetical protein